MQKVRLTLRWIGAMGLIIIMWAVLFHAYNIGQERQERYQNEQAL